MGSHLARLHEERTDLRVWLASGVVGAVGVAILLVAAAGWWKGLGAIQAVLNEVGALLLASVTVNLLWHLSGKRAFLDELLARMRLSEDIRHAGITGYTEEFHRQIDWNDMFSGAREVDIFVAYARTWRNTYSRQFDALATRSGVRIRVALPDVEDGPTANELARRFDCSPAELRASVAEAASFFLALDRRAAGGARSEVWLVRTAPQFAYYRFDRVAVLALYTHRNERGGVPTFVSDDSGSLFSFLKRDFEALIDPGGGRSRLLGAREGTAA